MPKKTLKGQPSSQADVRAALEAALKHVKAGTLGSLRLTIHAPLQGDPAGTDYRMWLIHHPPEPAKETVVGVWESDHGDEDDDDKPAKKTRARKKS